MSHNPPVRDRAGVARWATSLQDACRPTSGLRAELAVSLSRLPRTIARHANRTHRIVLTMTQEEHARIQKAAALVNKSAAALILQILRNDGSL